MEKETKIEVVKEMLGEIEPVGDTWKDNETYENFEIWAIIFEYMTMKLTTIADYYKNDNRYTCNRAGANAFKILLETHKQTEDLFEQD